MTAPALFEERKVRRVFHKEAWWFVINDIVSALTETVDPVDYLKKLRRRDPALAETFKGGGKLSPPLRSPLIPRADARSCNAGTSQVSSV